MQDLEDLCWKNPNIKVHSATSYLSSSICNTGITSIFQNLPVFAILVLPVFSRIFQYLQYWYYQYFPESSSICNTGITSISQNPPVSAILVLPVFPRIFRYLQYSYFANDQYLLVLQILENSGRYWDTSIYQYLYQYCRYWKILVKYWYYQYCVPVLEYQYRGRLLHIIQSSCLKPFAQ